MSDPDQSGTSRDEAGSEQGTPAQDEAQSTAATSESGGATEESQAGQSKTGQSKTAESETAQADESEAAESTSSSAGKSASAESTGASGTASDSSASTQKLDTAAASAEKSSGKSAGKSSGKSAGASAAGSDQAGGSGDASATSEQQAVDGQSDEGQSGEGQSGEQPKKSKAGVLLGVVSGAFVLLLALVLVAFFVWPGYAGPGSPDSEVDKTTAALASKDAGQLEQVSCHSPDGKPTAQIPPQAMQLIQEAKPAGAPQLVVDTEAHAPVDLTLSAQGQTQTLPSVAVMGVSDHQWCLKGLAQRQ